MTRSLAIWGRLLGGYYLPEEAQGLLKAIATTAFVW